MEQQNGYDSLQRDKAVCISTNGESNEEHHLFFFPQTHNSPWFFISLDQLQGDEQLHLPFMYVLLVSLKVFGEIMDLLLLLAVVAAV